ncbi:hypothetical protein AVEN_203102-1 [Araneus ventricosus]|uniref:Uncharacterized protein n=1 Tax=Araneus ventricosus TaxID=182803 RepID=A0A4Y2DT96_ARAVE|nr:hypothetical protein AVEN_203102-1 [Araneus ventricosus]
MNLWQTRFESEGGDSALLVCHSFALSLTRQICHDKLISSQNQTCCRCTCYLGGCMLDLKVVNINVIYCIKEFIICDMLKIISVMRFNVDSRAIELIASAGRAFECLTEGGRGVAPALCD